MSSVNILLKNTNIPLGFYRRKYNENIEEKKREVELEHQRRQQEDIAFRSHVDEFIERFVVHHCRDSF
jgi:hypothetical protein